MSLRLLVYDGTAPPPARGALVGERALRAAWSTGARFYRALGRIDAHHGATSWADALEWLGRFRGSEPIAEIQYWGHGKWGTLFIASDALTASAFAADHPRRGALEAVRRRLLPDARSLLWFRTCETFGAAAGHDFAQRASAFFGARTAGHTHVIGALQSGLHGIAPGARPHWPAEEGLARGTAEVPIEAHGSSLRAPHTIHFMDGAVPEAWFGPR